MTRWLMKSEPDVWSWDDQMAKAPDSEEWDGIRNYQARNNMRKMRIGDRAFFYHSQTEKAIVGIVEVTAESHPDSTTDDDRWDCVDVRAVKAFPKPVTLAECKATEQLNDMVLVNNSRLSVQPVRDYEWEIICRMGGLKGD
ncbi:MAG: EVE domain-containing protein [Rhodobacteraceae bacterium]|nr:EVE domain-containing protein [Paracoccaceae bacterium]